MTAARALRIGSPNVITNDDLLSRGIGSALGLDPDFVRRDEKSRTDL